MEHAAHAPRASGLPQAPPKASDDREPLSGLVERVVFHNVDTGFAVLRVRTRSNAPVATVVGVVAAIAEGEYLQASGNWETSREHGRQFRARHLHASAPSSIEGIERYLGSGLIKGIGPAYASRLVAAFGDDVFDVIEKQPERLREIEGIGPTRARRITDGWADQKVVRDIMVFLQSHGVSTARALRIFKTYGADSLPLISENPYRLAQDIRGVGFRTADKIAARLGVAPDSPLRARAALAWILGEATSQGHCALPRAELVSRGEELLEIPAAVLESALAAEIAGERLVADSIGDTDCIFLADLWQAERSLAERLRTLAAGEPPWERVDSSRALPWVEQQLGFELAPSQRAALERLLRAKAAALTGGPGVGKTTLVLALLRILSARRVSTALCAPTGRAAKRLAESTGAEAKTIHRLLEASPRGFKRGPDNPIECDLLVVDEASMVDVPLLERLVAATPERAAILLIGDVDQLPPVGPGQALADILESGLVPVARLHEIFRQAARSTIVTNAHRVNRGEMPELQESGDGTRLADFFFVDATDADDAIDKLVRMIRDRIPRRFGLDPRLDVQVLCPMNRGPLGAHRLNEALQEALNPPTAEPGIERFGWTFRIGDKVMQTENDYDKEVFNGDLGVIESIDRSNDDVVIVFDGRPVSYQVGELDRIALAYAITIHKSQGSEYPAVIMPLSTQHYVMLQRKLLYTGITRGRSLVVLLGERRALAMAVRGTRTSHRWSKLCERLQDDRA
jgi:exodeoxyribonuclease V alpha subunit